MDDIVITGDDHAKISRLKHILHSRFSIKDLGILKFFWDWKLHILRREYFSISINMCLFSLGLLQDTSKLRTNSA